MVENELIGILTNKYENVFLKQTLLKKFNGQNSYTDALRKVLKPEHITDRWNEKLYQRNEAYTFVSDFKYGNYMACMAYLNCGADDFNAVEYGYCPSFCIAVVFDSYRNNLYSMPNVKGHINTLNDFLYMYRKLKESPRGLNTTILNEHPQIQDTLKAMDALLLMPEEKRFSLSKPEHTEQEQKIEKVAKKNSFFKKIAEKLKIFTRA